MSVPAAQTVLDVLQQLFPDSSKTTLRRMLQSDRVRVNGVPERDAKRLIASDDRVEVASKSARPIDPRVRIIYDRPNMRKYNRHLRRKCTMKSAALMIVLLAAHANAATQPHTQNFFRCGIQITLPHQWRPGPSKVDAEVCEFGVAPINWQHVRKESDVDLPAVPITVTVTHDQFDDAASDAGFMTVAELRKRQGEPTACEDLAPGKWLIMGGRGSQLCGEAIDVHGEQFTGIAGLSSYGRLKKRTGRYAGLGESCSAVVQKGSTIVVIGATEIDFESTFLPIVTSPDYSPNQLK